MVEQSIEALVSLLTLMWGGMMMMMMMIVMRIHCREGG